MSPEERDVALAPFGFSKRQTRFLDLVMRHSGVCVQRQYAAHAGIVHGQKTRAFFAKLVRRGFASAFECRHNRGRVYHLHHHALYAGCRPEISPSAEKGAEKRERMGERASARPRPSRGEARHERQPYPCAMRVTRRRSEHAAFAVSSWPITGTVRAAFCATRDRGSDRDGEEPWRERPRPGPTNLVPARVKGSFTPRFPVSMSAFCVRRVSALRQVLNASSLVRRSLQDRGL